MRPFRWIGDKVIAWLIYEKEVTGVPLCNFDRLRTEIRACDVLLVEGRSRVSDVIKNVTQSIWTHAALYIGRLSDIQDVRLRDRLARHYHGDHGDQLIIEALLGHGTIIGPLSKYRSEHIRICRPRGLSTRDAQQVIAVAAGHLGNGYDVRQLLDLARFLYPYGILPRRWRSSLFERNVGKSTRTVCSTVIAEAFASVKFPVLPVIHETEDGRLRFYKRNTRFYTPRDFDYSPYFEIIKCPLLGMDDISVYHHLPWDERGIVCDNEDECYLSAGFGAEPAGPVREVLAEALDEPAPPTTKPIDKVFKPVRRR